MSPPHVLRLDGRSRRGRMVALLAALVLVVSLAPAPGSGPAAAGPPTATSPAAAPGPLPSDVEPVAVTLITGDTVQWYDAGGGSPRVEIDPADRDHPVTFDQSGTQEDFYVIPTDVIQHVVAGTVDRELFNVPGLIRQGLDDEATDQLPVIVTFDHDRSSQQLRHDADALPATSTATAVTEVNGAGVAINRSNADTFRKAVFGTPGPEGSTRTAGARGLDGAVEKIMLDRVLEIDLAESVPQIGAPQAWDAGYTGEGVTVAVLDTGIDTNHPDLAGQVVATANFTDEPDATDTHGHGTHVASTVAGTGAASDGARTGVAPDADLLSGKVCNTDGDCRTSWIMAGMEWATSQGADVVNMSLGGAPTDGSDPLSQLVDQLSAETGTLFVISAGNLGFSDLFLRVVGSPAAADAALAVGAVDKSDQMASFSSRGPRVGNHAVKPETTAPGVGIVAARAEGTGIGDPVDNHYTSLDGTSMASPHVAGAAALLAQATGLAGDDLKDVLVSTAADGGHSWYQQGTGRVDVPAALNSPVYAQGTVNLGGINGQADHDLVYTNRSENDVTLSLEAAANDLDGQLHDGITMSTDTLTVPANGNATVTVTVTLDASDLTGQESFGGVVAATGPNNVVLRTGIGYGPPLHRVTIEVLDSGGNRLGTPTAPDTRVDLFYDTFDPQVGGTTNYSFNTSQGVATGHVPAGTYTVFANALETNHDTGPVVRGSGLVAVEIAVDSDTRLTLDARNAVPVQVNVPRKVGKRGHEVGIARQGPLASFYSDLGGPRYPVYVTPTPPGELGYLALWVRWHLAEPQPLQPLWGSSACPGNPRSCYSHAPAYIYNLALLYENGIPQNLHEKVSRRDLVAVPTRYHSEKPDVLIQRDSRALPPPGIFVVPVQQTVWIQPGQVTEYFLADDQIIWDRFASRVYREGNAPPTFSFAQRALDRFPTSEAGARRDEESWFEGPVRAGVADIREEFLGNPLGFEVEAVSSRGGLDSGQFVPGYQLNDNTRGHIVTDWRGVSWRMWNLDTGTELDGIPFDSRGHRDVPAFSLAIQAATYRLEQVEDYPTRVVGDLFRTGPATTTWTFTSRPSVTEVPDGYLCPIQQAPRENICQIQPLIQLEYDLGLDINNGFPARRGAHVFTITAGHHSKAIDRSRVTSMTVQASFDEGDTWQDARVVGRPKDTWDTGGHLSSVAPYQEFRVVLKIPPLHRTDGFVTLRVQAEDAHGGTVEQTIHRAYILK